ncbi:MAG: N-acetylmuramoyl-L-alanine amidase [Christensenellaceae bacterium]
MIKKMILAVISLMLIFGLWGCAEQEKPAEEAQQASLENLKIIIDPGHGAEDVGTIGVSTGRQEKEVNLEIAQKLKKLFEDEGVAVVMTRDSDEPIAPTKEDDMLKRTEIIKTENADLFISIHQNRFDTPDAKNPQVFYLSDGTKGKDLAVCIQEKLNEDLKIENPRRALSGNYRLLKPGNQPSCIVECGFFSNPEEEKLLQDSDYQDKVAAAIVDGAKYYVTKYPISAQ